MIRGSYGIVFDLKGDHSIENIKRRLHSVLNKMFGDYYNKNWIDNRIYLEVTTRNVFIENEDLARSLFSEGIVALEMNICQEFQPLTIFAFYLDDSTGGRGLSLLDTNTNDKRLWIDSEFEGVKNTGSEIIEENFIRELSEGTTVDGDEELKIYYHIDYKNPIHGRRGVIEKVIRRIFLNRFMFDYEWQEYRGEIELLETDDLPIQDLYLLPPL